MTSWLDGKHVVFGKIPDGDTESYRVVRSLEHVDTKADKPVEPATIVKSGEA